MASKCFSNSETFLFGELKTSPSVVIICDDDQMCGQVTRVDLRNEREGKSAAPSPERATDLLEVRVLVGFLEKSIVKVSFPSNIFS